MSPIAASRYEQIADEIRRAIVDQSLPPGTKLPPVRELAQTHNVSTRTIVEATRLLLGEGLLTSKQRGSIVVRARPTVVRMARTFYQGAAGKGSPWRADMAAQGRIGDWESHSEETAATPAIAERLGIEPGARTMRTSYVFRADGEPVYLSTSWEPLALTLGTPITLPEAGPHAGKGVQDRMALIGHKPTSCTEEILPHTLTIAEAELLGLHAGAAVVVTQRTYYDGELPVETADILYPPHVRPVYDIPVSDTP